MRRNLLIANCMAIVVLFGMGTFPSRVFSQTGIFVIPENPSEIDSLEVTINAVTWTYPAWIMSTSYEVSEGLIKIIADVGCGDFYAESPYEFTIIVPPVATGTYDIEYWSTEECHGSNPVLSSEIVILPEPIATERTTWGAIKALWQ